MDTRLRGAIDRNWELIKKELIHSNELWNYTNLAKQNSRLSWKSSSRYRVSRLHPQDSHKNINEDIAFGHKELGFRIYQGFYQGNIDRYMAEHSNLWIPSSEYFHKSPKFAKCLKLGQPSSHQRPFQNLRCHFMQFPFSVHLASTESKFGFDANRVCLLGYVCINPSNI